jgi:hypothetical protein
MNEDGIRTKWRGSEAWDGWRKARDPVKGVEAMVHRDGACTASMARVATSTAIHWAKRAVGWTAGRCQGTETLQERRGSGLVRLFAWDETPQRLHANCLTGVCWDSPTD